MQATLSTLIERLDAPAISATGVIPWGSPILSFGDLSRSKIATLGLNPSNREFVDAAGNELDGEFRRFHTLTSLGLTRWSDVSAGHLRSIVDYCYNYFSRNPYDGWFRALDYIISGTKASYYGASARACHLDLVPYATECKWSDLTNLQREMLLAQAGDTLGILLRESSISTLVLNGKTVVENLEKVAGARFEKEPMHDWILPRKATHGVTGYAYRGVVCDLAGVNLGREIRVLGFNHNIQSSFGVTKRVRAAIRDWVSTLMDGASW